jgi:hypothetical protein
MARAERSLRARSRHIERPIIRARTRARRERLACSIGNAGNSGAHGDCSCFSVPNFSVPKFKSDRRHLDQPPDRSGAWAIKLDPEGLMEPCAPAWYYPQAAWCYPRPLVPQAARPQSQKTRPPSAAAGRAGSASRSIVNVTIGFHVPGMVRPLDKAVIGSGEGGIAENVGMIGWIDSVQAARLHKPAAMMTAIEERPSRRGGADNTQGGGDCKHDESFLSTHVAAHGGFPSLSGRDTQHCALSRLNWDA